MIINYELERVVGEYHKTSLLPRFGNGSVCSELLGELDSIVEKHGLKPRESDKDEVYGDIVFSGGKYQLKRDDINHEGRSRTASGKRTATGKILRFLLENAGKRFTLRQLGDYLSPNSCFSPCQLYSALKLIKDSEVYEVTKEGHNPTFYGAVEKGTHQDDSTNLETDEICHKIKLVAMEYRVESIEPRFGNGSLGMELVKELESMIGNALEKLN